MQFPILVKTGTIRYHLICRLWYADKVKEQYRVHPKENPEKYYLIQNNRPFIRGKGLKQRRIDWKLLEGTISNKYIFDQIINLIQERIEPQLPEQSLYDLDADNPLKRSSYNRKKPGNNMKPLGER